MKTFSTLDLKTLVLISYTWCSYHSQRKEQSEDEATSRRQKTEKGHGGRGGI